MSVVILQFLKKTFIFNIPRHLCDLTRTIAFPFDKKLLCEFDSRA